MASREGLLLVNLGTPAAATRAAVREYLAEFLSDPRVVEIPRWLWLPILYGLILNLRPQRSAEKYAAIWSDEGSPLAVHTARQAALLGERLGATRVAHAMRYGTPRIGDAIRALEGAGCTRIRVLPLYPQYAASTTASIEDVLHRTAQAGAPALCMIASFHDHPAYIGALADTVHAHWERSGEPELLLMSFHGLPQRAVDRGDPYQRQCLETGRLLGAALGLDPRRYRITFQSRFGPARWLQPYTEPTLVELARGGTRRVDVVCPGFVSDCLETLEEIGLGAREAFLGNGGEAFSLVPCLNETPAWIEALGRIAAEQPCAPIDAARPS